MRSFGSPPEGGVAPSDIEGTGSLQPVDQEEPALGSEESDDERVPENDLGSVDQVDQVGWEPESHEHPRPCGVDLPRRPVREHERRRAGRAGTREDGLDAAIGLQLDVEGTGLGETRILAVQMRVSHTRSPPPEPQQR